MTDEMWSKALRVRSERCGLMRAGILIKSIAITPSVSIHELSERLLFDTSFHQFHSSIHP